MSQNSKKELFWFGAIIMLIGFALIMALKPKLIHELLNPLLILAWFLWPPCLLFLVSKKHRAAKRAVWKTRSAEMVVAEYVYIFLPPVFFWGIAVYLATH